MTKTPASTALIACSLFAIATASGHPILAGLDRMGNEAMEPALAGTVLLGELNCTTCHAAGEGTVISPKGAPDLTTVTHRLQPGYLETFIADPHAALPGTTMPDVLGDLPKDERNHVARSIAAYLNSRANSAPEADPAEPGAVERGRTLFHKVGCVACHSPESEALAHSFPLHQLEEKYRFAGLAAFLEEPLAVRRGGRMPDMNLDHWEALDLASYLLRDQSSLPPAAVPAPHLASEGAAFFQSYGCAQCHEPAAAKPSFAPPLDTLGSDASCRTAHFSLSKQQANQIRSALVAPIDAPQADTLIDLTLIRFNCIACHDRNAMGGIDAERDAYFTTSNLNLGEEARVPPTLTGVGAKLSSVWLRKVIVSGASARPYMDTRMPRFGEGNVDHLVELFAEADTLPVLEFERTDDEKIARKAGVDLAGNKNLSCIACHTFKGESATTLNALELTTMAERLQENWFHHYMRAPERFHPSTIMPNFWPGGEALRPEVLDGDAGIQIDALWQYLSRGREARPPAGMVREPLPYGPTGDEAVMLRRQYRGIGKRGIGVGYPSGINLSFDAGQMRLGSIWAGEFGEMSGVWRGQGSGSVGERSRDVARFPAGPALALLESPDTPWPGLEESERPEDFHFKGYTLDARQRPTFEYVFAGRTITDAFIDRAEGPSLIRKITFDKPAPRNLYLRIAAATDLTKASGANVYHLPRNLTIHVPPGTVLRESSELPELVLPLAGAREATIEYRFNTE